MVVHIVMWNFKAGIEQEQKAALKSAMEEHLCALVGQVPGLISAEFVSDPISSSSHEIALVSTFEKAEDIAAYSGHPAHVAVADTYVRPYVCDRACLDFVSAK